MGMFYKLMIITIQGPITCEYDYYSKHSSIIFLFTMLFNFGSPLFPTGVKILLNWVISISFNIISNYVKQISGTMRLNMFMQCVCGKVFPN